METILLTEQWDSTTKANVVVHELKTTPLRVDPLKLLALQPKLAMDELDQLMEDSISGDSESWYTVKQVTYIRGNYYIERGEGKTTNDVTLNKYQGTAVHYSENDFRLLMDRYGYIPGGGQDGEDSKSN